MNTTTAHEDARAIEPGFSIHLATQAAQLARLVQAHIAPKDGPTYDSATQRLLTLSDRILADAAERHAEIQQYHEAIASARGQYCNDDLEIDDTPLLSVGDGGLWVSAWVWVPAPA